MISVSIVTYKTSKEDIDNLHASFAHCQKSITIYIIDNSPTDDLKIYFLDYENIIYIHNPSNPGFGASHNLAIQKAIEENSQYHFVVNPDVYFKEDVITKMIRFMQSDQQIGMMMPQILNLDGTIQNLPKLLPSPFSLVLRKLKKPKFIYEKFINNYELRNIDPSLTYNAPILSGCFTLFNLEALKEIGLYDDRFFMYFEDWDISRRMHLKYKTIYYPEVSIYHGYESGANRSKHLFKIFVQSAKSYFNKWGWFIDWDRAKINSKTLKQFQ